MLLLDASVIVSIIGNEPDAEELLDRLNQEECLLCISSVVRMESVMAISRIFRDRDDLNLKSKPELFSLVRKFVEQFAEDLRIREISIDPIIGEYALDASSEFGKLSGHKAGLNMGDCYTYACAKHLGAKIAYKSNDFIHTDLGW